jgi:GntR family transcriptional regulator/MocR family aminotransferase
MDRRSSKPLYQQIYEAYRRSILRGQLRVGQLVPSTRELARYLRVSRLPVLNAYAQLVAEGYFDSQPGAGTFIAASPGRSFSLDRSNGASSEPSERRPISTRAAALPEYEDPFWVQRTGPFQLGQPELRDFPLDIWSKLVARHSRRVKLGSLRYGDPMGLRELREVIATYLRTARAVGCETEQIMIVSGSQQALDISARVLLDPGARVWVEEPGYWLVHQVVTAAGCRAIPVPVDEEGLNVKKGITLSRKARAAFVTPSHHNPLGVTMSAARRFELLEWAAEAGAWIIEDDYDSEYRFDSVPISSLQALDVHSRVIYTGTFSKVLFPSLRLGYVVIPEDLVDRFAAIRQSMDLCPSSANQEVLSEFIREGHFARHIRRMRRVYEERRAVLVEHLQHQLGDACRIIGAEAGMHLALLVDGDVRDQEIAVRAAEHKLWLSPLSSSYLGKHPQKGFVLGFGSAPVSQIPAAVHLLKNLLGR